MVPARETRNSFRRQAGEMYEDLEEDSCSEEDSGTEDDDRSDCEEGTDEDSGDEIRI